MQLLLLLCKENVEGVEDHLKDGIDVNSMILMGGPFSLHIAACDGHLDVIKLLLSWKANVDARDRWGSTAAADSKFYGNGEVYNILRARGATVPKTRKTPTTVSNPREVPEYELRPGELQFRLGDEIVVGTYQTAKSNGTKVSVKILSKESYSDPDSINAFKRDLTLMEKPHKALRFAIDNARDRDGIVTPEEVGAAATYLNDTVNKEGIEELIHNLSKDREGKILVEVTVKLGTQSDDTNRDESERL